MTIEPTSFEYEHDTATSVATITLNRPDRLNALTFEVYQQLGDTFRALDTEPGVRVVLITGAGKGFCSGGDVEDIIGALFARDFEGLHDFTRLTCDLVLAIRQCRRPVVAALNGTVAGAGAVIATACDVRIAAESAKIAYLFTRVGLSGADMGSAWMLPRIVGLGIATELLMSGEFIDPHRAERIGLYNRVVADADLPRVAREYAEKLAQGPSYALGITKDALNREAAMDLAGALEAEAQAQAGCMEHPNFRESYEAFMAKRPPRFSEARCPTSTRSVLSWTSTTWCWRIASVTSANARSRRYPSPTTIMPPACRRARSWRHSGAQAGFSRSSTGTCGRVSSFARPWPRPPHSPTRSSLSRRSAPCPSCSPVPTSNGTAGCRG